MKRHSIILMCTIILGNCVYGEICAPFDINFSTFSDTKSDLNTYQVKIIKHLQSGITWYFHEYCTAGTFANGDYWVLGPVTIDSITPSYDGYNNGWEVNPKVGAAHGFQKGCDYDGFDSTLIPKLPYLADPTNGALSIIKSTASGKGCPCLKTAAVLTVVASIPPGNGKDVFRPPYVGSEKPYYYIDSIRKELLPSLPKVANMPTLDHIKRRFAKLQIDHKPGLGSRSLRPEEHMDDYVPANTPEQNNAVLRFMINDSYEVKKQALINFIEFGIDKIHCMYLGQRWPHSGAHQPGHRLVLAFAAVMLNIEKAKKQLREATFFHGNQFFKTGINGFPLWGESAYSSEYTYWKYIMTRDGNKSQKDPYGYIDGGNAGQNSYQFIVSQSYKGEMLATHLMPELLETYNDTEWEITQQYADRWVMHGVWTQPDPYAPYDGDTSHYGKTFGPDPDNPGDGIKGEGRYPNRHGVNRDAGQYRSSFVDAMWKTYRATAPGADTTPPVVMFSNYIQGDTISGIVRLNATAFSIHGLSSVELVINGANKNLFFSNDSIERPTYYSIDWDTKNLPNGNYNFQAVATDNIGNISSSEIVLFISNSGFE